jgi:GntR family transcriptional repressor for pyruvate dehydrogenase complex
MARRASKNRQIPNVQTSSQEIAKKLTRRIFQGEFPTGTKLPAERELAVQFGVARNVVREAIKRLEAVGAVRSWRGSGVYVQDLEFARGVDVFDTLVTQEDGSINVPFLRDVLEFRGYFFRLVVRLAAVRRTEEELKAIKQLVKQQEKFRKDSQGLAEITRELFRQFTDATHNRVCQGLFTTVERISAELLALVDLTTIDFDQRQKAYERVVDAFEEKDPAMAELAVVRYLQALEKALSSDTMPQGLLDLTP